jgi:hypothetical protein
MAVLTPEAPKAEAKAATKKASLKRPSLGAVSEFSRRKKGADPGIWTPRFR